MTPESFPSLVFSRRLWVAIGRNDTSSLATPLRPPWPSPETSCRTEVAQGSVRPTETGQGGTVPLPNSIEDPSL